MSGTKTYSIADLSREFDVTTRTVRFYEEKGLLAPKREGVTRVYSSADRTKLKLILRGKRLGLTLEESREIIDLYNPKEGNRLQLENLISKIHERQNMLRQQLLDIESTMLDLQEAEQKCLAALKSDKLKS